MTKQELIEKLNSGVLVIATDYSHSYKWIVTVKSYNFNDFFLKKMGTKGMTRKTIKRYSYKDLIANCWIN